MSCDVMRNPPTVATTLTWYRPSDTTPFAVSGHEGTVLAMLNEDKFGPGPQEVWFIGGEWQDSEGGAIHLADILAFAIPTAPDLKLFGETLA
jgi:hypothetical protein